MRSQEITEGGLWIGRFRKSLVMEIVGERF